MFKPQNSKYVRSSTVNNELQRILKKEFNHSNAIKLDSQLNESGFFKANHKLKLSNGDLIKNERELNNLIAKEKNLILKEMETEFDNIDNKLVNSKNNFNQLIQEFHDSIRLFHFFPR